MATALTSDVQFTSDGLATVIRLPTRPQSPARFIGCVPMIVGAFVLLFCFVWLWTLLDVPNQPIPLEGPAPARGPDFFAYFMALFSLPFIFGGFAFIYAGLRLLLPNTSTIRITDTEIRVTEKAGPFPKTRKRPLNDISQLRIADTFTAPGGPQGSSFLVDCKIQPMLTVAAGYPKDTVIAAANLVADELKRRHLPIERPLLEAANASLDGGATSPADASLGTTETSSDITFSSDQESTHTPTAPAPPPPQPSDSKITCIPAVDSLTLMIPRTGVKGVAVFFLLFSLFWNGITWCVTTGFIVAFFSQPSLENVLPLLFLLLFIAIGAGMFLAFLQTAFRRAVILATPSSLVLNQQGPVRSREFQWMPDQLKSIASDYSGTTINGRRLRELRINLATGTHHGFFDGRDDNELEWLAHTLRYYYHL